MPRTVHPYEEISQEINELADTFGMPMDSEIKELVIALRMNGVDTKLSCEGHADQCPPYPWIAFPSAEVITVGNLLCRANANNGWVLQVQQGHDDLYRLVPWDTSRPLIELQEAAAKLARDIQGLRSHG